MTGEQTLALRGAIGCTMGALSIAAWTLAPRLKSSAAAFNRLFLGLFAASRLGVFALVMLVLHMTPRGDITLYMLEAAPALAGKLIYRDFITPHAPLDPYILSSMLRLHQSPLTIIFFCICFDIAAMFFWSRSAPGFLSRTTYRRAALLVLCNPTSLLTEAVDGQMNSLIALGLALGVYCLYRNRDLLAGAAAAMPTACVKFLALIYAPGFLFASRRKGWATAGFVGLLLLVYVPFALAGADLTVPLHAEGAHVTDANAIYTFALVTGHDLGLRLPDAILGLSWLFIVGLTFFCMRAVRSDSKLDRRRTLTLLTLSLIAELLCIQIFSKNTWDRYLVMAMFPLCTLVADLTLAEVIAFAVYAADIVWEPSYWADHAMPTALSAHALLGHSAFARNLLAAESIQTVGSILLWIAVVRRMLAVRTLPAVKTEAGDDPEPARPPVSGLSAA